MPSRTAHKAVPTIYALLIEAYDRDLSTEQKVSEPNLGRNCKHDHTRNYNRPHRHGHSKHDKSQAFIT